MRFHKGSHNPTKISPEAAERISKARSKPVLLQNIKGQWVRAYSHYEESLIEEGKILGKRGSE